MVPWWQRQLQVETCQCVPVSLSRCYCRSSSFITQHVDSTSMASTDSAPTLEIEPSAFPVSSKNIVRVDAIPIYSISNLIKLFPLVDMRSHHPTPSNRVIRTSFSYGELRILLTYYSSRSHYRYLEENWGRIRGGTSNDGMESTWLNNN